MQQLHILIMAWLVWLSLFPAYAQQIELNNSPREFRESITENSKVSGDVIVGAMLASDLAQTEPPRVTPTTPNIWHNTVADTHVCVRIISKDGRYEAINDYVVPAGYARDVAEFPYGGENPGFLAERNAVVRIGLGPCGTRTEQLVPAGWRETAQLPARALQVFVNSAGSLTLVAVGTGQDYFEECQDVSKVNGLKYTTLCEVPFEHLRKDVPTSLTFLIARNNTEDRFTVLIAPLGSYD